MIEFIDLPKTDYALSVARAIKQSYLCLKTDRHVQLTIKDISEERLWGCFHHPGNKNIFEITIEKSFFIKESSLTKDEAKKIFLHEMAHGFAVDFDRSVFTASHDWVWSTIFLHLLLECRYSYQYALIIVKKDILKCVSVEVEKHNSTRNISEQDEEEDINDTVSCTLHITERFFKYINNYWRKSIKCEKLGEIFCQIQRSADGWEAKKRSRFFGPFLVLRLAPEHDEKCWQVKFFKIFPRRKDCYGNY